MPPVQSSRVANVHIPQQPDRTLVCELHYRGWKGTTVTKTVYLRCWLAKRRQGMEQTANVTFTNRVRTVLCAVAPLRLGPSDRRPNARVDDDAVSANSFASRSKRRTAAALATAPWSHHKCNVEGSGVTSPSMGGPYNEKYIPPFQGVHWATLLAKRC